VQRFQAAWLPSTDEDAACICRTTASPVRSTCSTRQTQSPTLPQLTELTRLRKLQLFNTSYTAASQAGLSALAGSLTALELSECNKAPLPRTLAALTGLAHLSVEGLSSHTPHAALEAALVHALPMLRRLTHLSLQIEGLIPLPAALAHAPELRQLCLYSGVGYEPPPPGCALPCGPWPQLQELELSWPHLLGSAVASLEQMGRLTALTINTKPRTPPPAQLGAWDAFWAWAAHHQPLRDLVVSWMGDEGWDEAGEEEQQVSLTNAMLTLQRTRPELHVAAKFP